MDRLFTMSLEWVTLFKYALAVYRHVKKNCVKNVWLFNVCVIHTGPSVVQDDDILKVFQRTLHCSKVHRLENTRPVFSLFTTCGHFCQWGYSTDMNTKECMSENPTSGLSQLPVHPVKKVLWISRREESTSSKRVQKITWLCNIGKGSFITLIKSLFSYHYLMSY